MLAPSRNTTEQRYQTNPLGLESNPGSPFSLWKHPLTRQQESKSNLWTNNKRLPADEESLGGQLFCSPLTRTAREAGRRVFSLDYMDLISGATTAKDAAKGTKEQAVQAFVSSEERFPPPGKLRTRQSLSKLLFLKANTRPRRVEASKPAKHPLLSPEVFPPLSSHDVAIRKQAELLGQAEEASEPLQAALLSRTMEQDVSKPRNQQRILCCLQTCFLPSQVVALPSETLEKPGDDAGDINKL